jgi:hypothetical protein
MQIAMKYINLLVFAILVAASSYLFDQYLVAEIYADQKQSFEYLVLEDLNKLKADKILPTELGSIREVFVADHRTRKFPIKWKKMVREIFPKASDEKNAKYNLQITAFDDTTDPIMVLQMSLFDAGTENKIWELSRSYPTPANSVSNPAGSVSK